MKKWTAEEIVQTLNENSATLSAMGVKRLGIFGSYARGEPTEDSDMDFVITLERPSFRDYANLLNFLEDTFGCSVDLAFEHTLRPEIRPQVMKDVVYVPKLSALS